MSLVGAGSLIGTGGYGFTSNTVPNDPVTSSDDPSVPRYRDNNFNLGPPLEQRNEAIAQLARQAGQAAQHTENSRPESISESVHNQPTAPAALDYSAAHRGDETLNNSFITSKGSLGVYAPKQSLTANHGYHEPSQLAALEEDDDHRGLFDYLPGSEYDPHSEKFNAAKWVKKISGLASAQGPSRRSGISYKNMSVHGYGSDAGEFPKPTSSSLDVIANLSARSDIIQTTRRLSAIWPSRLPRVSGMRSRAGRRKCKSSTVSTEYWRQGRCLWSWVLLEGMFRLPDVAAGPIVDWM